VRRRRGARTGTGASRLSTPAPPRRRPQKPGEGPQAAIGTTEVFECRSTSRTWGAEGALARRGAGAWDRADSAGRPVPRPLHTP